MDPIAPTLHRQLKALLQTKPLFNEFVVKIASRCNLNCDYCYEYNLGDESWRAASKFMSEDVVKALAFRISEHAKAHGLREVFVNFHGGEPLLAGHKRIDLYATILRQAAQDDYTIIFGMQTNAVLIDENICDVLAKHKISVSVSLDGGQIENDRHRVDHKGLSSFQATLRGMEVLKSLVPGQPSGLLAVIDSKNDPIAVFDFLSNLDITHIDFLLPYDNWDRPPPRNSKNNIEYGEWLYKIFDSWISGRHSKVDIRFFKNIILNFMGKNSNFEAMNLAPVQLVTVSTDGAIEAVDTLKSTASGVQNTGLNVVYNSFDEALQERIIESRQSGVNQLCAICRDCKYMRECAGGYFPHRYSNERQFDNPSVYCEDLFWLLDNIERKLKEMQFINQIN